MAIPYYWVDLALEIYVEANLTFCKCRYRGYGERNPHQDKTQSNGKAKMAIPYYWVDLALERLTLSYSIEGMGSEIHIKIKLKVMGKPKWRYRITGWILLLKD